MTNIPQDKKNHRNWLGVALVVMGCAVLIALALWAPVARAQLIVSGLPAMWAIATVCLTPKRRK